MAKNIKYHIIKTSTVDNPGLTSDYIQKVITAYNLPCEKEFWKKYLDSGLKKYDKYPVAKWQLKKGEEIRNLFFENLKYELTEEKITLSTEFDVTLPKSFDHGDVCQWTMWFNDIYISYSNSIMEDMVNSIEIDKKSNEIIWKLFDMSNENSFSRLGKQIITKI